MPHIQVYIYMYVKCKLYVTHFDRDTYKIYVNWFVLAWF